MRGRVESGGEKRKGGLPAMRPHASAKGTWSRLDNGTHSILSSGPDGTALLTFVAALGGKLWLRH